MPHCPLPRSALSALAALAALHAAPAAAQAPVPPAEPGAFRSELIYALGGNLLVSPSYAGSASRQIRLRPLWALRYGRYRLSGSGAGGLLASPGDLGVGASAQLLDRADWKLGAALRIDNGRKSSDDPALAGQPDVRRTLRGRVYSSRQLDGRWTAAGAVAMDLLGRGGGTTANLDLGYGWTPWRDLGASVGAGVTLADSRYLASYFGVTPVSAQATGHPVFSPRAGLLDLHAGLGLRQPLGPHWVLFGGLGYGQLQGDAAASPLTHRRGNLSANLALAWRSN